MFFFFYCLKVSNWFLFFCFLFLSFIAAKFCYNFCCRFFLGGVIQLILIVTKTATVYMMTMTTMITDDSDDGDQKQHLSNNSTGVDHRHFSPKSTKNTQNRKVVIATTKFLVFLLHRHGFPCYSKHQMQILYRYRSVVPLQFFGPPPFPFFPSPSPYPFTFSTNNYF